MTQVQSSYADAPQDVTSADLPLTRLIESASEYHRTGEVEQARQLYKSWIAHNAEHPQLYVAHFNCSSLDNQAKDLAAAAESLNNAIKLNPDFIPAYINLGRVFEEAGSLDRAVELWRMAANRTAPINGNSVVYATTALTQIARVMAQAQRSEDAEEAMLQCLDINPLQQDVIEQYTALRLAQCKWPIVISSERLDGKALLRGINPLSMAVFTDDPLLQLASAARYVNRAPWNSPQELPSDRRNATINLNARRIRVGYVSSDLRDHAIGYLMAELIELHNRSDIEVFAYYCGPESNSALTGRIKAAVEHWTDIKHLCDDEAAKLIAADGIDILVDVNGHTRDAKTGVFARRPAPIQVNWLGYPGSMGTSYHQYIIADDWIIPPGSEMYYSEKVMRLPCYQPNDRKRIVATQTPTRSDAGLPDNAFVFCCFNGTHKISRFTFERWLEILTRVPDSVLWLLDTTERTRERLRDYAEKKGVSRSRIIFAAKMQNSAHLARYQLADLFLDTVPYGAHTTASDALWMGVPVLTLSGRSFASRVCGSLVRSAGMADMVCTRIEDYVERAVAFGNDRAATQAHKTALKAMRDTCQLFDTDLLVRSLEDIYRSLCAEHQKGSVPRPDLTNMSAYFEAGIEHDHDNHEVLGIDDYHGMYRGKLKRFHLANPLPADTRLWGASDIAALDGIADRNTDIDVLRASAQTLNAQGRTLETLAALLALKAHTSDPEILLEEIRAVIAPASEGFNRAIAESKVEEAAKYADALAALIPGNIATLNSALLCSIALGRKPQAAGYAASLLGLDPSHAVARDFVADNDDAVVVSTPPVAVVNNAVHPLVQLRDLHDQASTILCGRLERGDAEKVGQLVRAARDLVVDVPPQSEWAGWVKHYQLAVEAVDLTAALQPTPLSKPEPDVSFVTSSGKSLDWKGVQAAAKKVGAKAVFFAAADRTYVDLYADCYISSILEHSDVPSLIVLHVIGGAGDLKDIAKSVGISSDRLIFAGDAFDAASVETKCYDTPPKGLSERPIAHFQSVRFLRLGALVRHLKLPVFVSDIDLILQRGVADLLDTFADHDVVLNENTHSTNAGSRYTANLLLLNPTKNASVFLRFLRAYLETALGGAEVSRWIDQFAIMQARHHLAHWQSKARVGFFDGSADINNLMYTSYQEHPYRFLSLYHGFDMSTLPSKAQSRTKPASREKTTVTAREASVRPKRAAGNVRRG